MALWGLLVLCGVQTSNGGEGLRSFEHWSPDRDSDPVISVPEDTCRDVLGPENAQIGVGGTEMPKRGVRQDFGPRTPLFVNQLVSEVKDG